MTERPDAKRFRLIVGYDGRPFQGWQSQAGGNTVQDRLLEALREISPEIATVQGSGRTDSGVSAIGQVAHFDAPGGGSMDAGAWLRALNTRLPATIRIMDASEVSSEFHARFSAIEKTYRYRIFTGPVLPPLDAGLAWHRPRFENVKDYRRAMGIFDGAHDFRAFSANRGDGRDKDRDTGRTVSGISVEEEGPWLSTTITGDGFLYKMVRFLVGSGIEAAAGKLSENGIRELLKGNSKVDKAPFCAPADGLTLVKVRYPT